MNELYAVKITEMVGFSTCPPQYLVLTGYEIQQALYLSECKIEVIY